MLESIIQSIKGVNFLEQFPKPLLNALKEVRKERVRGAAWCALRIIEGLLDSLSAGSKLCGISEKVYNAIIEANPSMSSLYWVAMTFKRGCELGDPETYLRRLLFEVSEARKRIPDNSLGILKKGSRIMTISYSSNVELVLRNAFRRKLLEEVIALESRPGGEGIRLAQSLKEFGINVKVIPDSTMHIYIKDIDFVMSGADTITNDGCLVHKVGTQLLARVAAREDVPFIVVFEPFKINMRLDCSTAPIIERSFEIEGWKSEVYPLFDITTPDLISKGITSEGIFSWSVDELNKIAETFLKRIFG